MWAVHHRDFWPDLDAREEPTTVGRRLDVGGFVFADPPEVLFRCIGIDYIRDAWLRLVRILSEYEIASEDLSWGILHPGESHVSACRWDDPCRFIGWTSPQLMDFDTHPQREAVEGALTRGLPRLGCGVTWRSLRWRIGGDEYALGLRLFEALATDEYTEWAPEVVLAVPRDDSEAWVRVAHAVKDRDQVRLDQAFRDAARAYSPVGYRIVVRGYQAYADGWELGLRFPVLSDPERNPTP